MHILLLNYEFPPLGGGAAPVTKELAIELGKKGHTFDLITMGFKGLPSEEKIGPIHVYRVPCRRAKKELSTTIEMLSFIHPAIRKATQLIKEKKYDLIHTHFIIPTGIIAWRLSKKHNIPYIISTHGSDIPGYNPDRFQIIHKIILPLWKKIIERSRGVITPSESLRQLILRSWKKNPEHIKTIPWGIKTPTLPTTKKENIILFAGRLFERKGAHYLLKAIQNTNIHGYKVVIVGDGPMRQELEDLAQGDSRVEFKGWIPREELWKLYARSKIFVFPSIQESFGMVIGESMAAGMTVITSNISAMPEVVGDTGILVQPKSVEEIRTALLQLTSNQKMVRTLGKKAKKRLQTMFTMKKVVESYNKIYNDTISKRNI